MLDNSEIFIGKVYFQIKVTEQEETTPSESTDEEPDQKVDVSKHRRKTLFEKIQDIQNQKQIKTPDFGLNQNDPE